MKFRTLKFYFQEGAVSLFKNRLMTLASIATIASCILLFIISYCAIANINYILKQVEMTVGITVFPVDEIDEQRLEALEKNLRSIRNVSSVKYISPDDALQSMKADLGEQGELLDIFETDNPFSRSFEISISSAENTKQVTADINKLSDVRKVKQAEKLVMFLINISNALSVLSIIAVVVLSAISIVIVMNTIKLTVYVRRKEINIMKYVGATDWFIRWPFIIEGVFIGLVGALLPSAVSWVSYGKVIEMVSEVLVITGIFSLLSPSDLFPFLFPVCLGGGALLGMCGSMYSVRRHLNV